MSIAQEFKAFVMRGNVVDLAVGVIIGAAFGKIVASLVADVIMPPIGLLMGGVNFTDIKFVLKDAVVEGAKTIPAVTLNIGNFIQTVVDFTVIAAAIFMMVRIITSLQKKREEAAPAVPEAPAKSELLLAEIRDLMASQRK